MPINYKDLRPIPGVDGVQSDGVIYIARVDVADPKTGRRRSKRKVCHSLQEAVLARESLATVVNAAKPERLRFIDYVERWLEVHSAAKAPTTRGRYVDELANICEVLGDQFVDTLTEEDILRWRNGFAPRNAPATVNGHLRTLRVVLEPLARDGTLRRNVARDVKALKEGRTKGARSGQVTEPRASWEGDSGDQGTYGSSRFVRSGCGPDAHHSRLDGNAPW